MAGSSADGAVISDRRRLGLTKDSYMGMRGIGASYGRVYQDRQLTAIGGVVRGRGFVVPMGFLFSTGRLGENGDSSRGVKMFAADGVGESRHQ